MDRRDFIRTSLLVSTGAVVAPGLSARAEDVFSGTIVPGAQYRDGKSGNPSNGVEGHLSLQGYVREPSHRIPVAASADVVVVGGGPAGVAASICAARQGASVILVEKANFLGGLWTGGLVLPVLATHALGRKTAWDKASGGFCAELCDELLENGWAVNPLNPTVEPEATKYLLDKKTLECGVKVLYNSTVSSVTMSGSRIDSILLDCNTGRIAIKCGAVVDASGDGVVFNASGDPHEDRLYHICSSYRTGGCSSDKCGSLTPNPEMKFKTIGTRQAEDGLDVFRVSELQREHRIGVWERISKLREDEECKDVYLMEMAPVTGVRVTRVLDSLHNVTLEESMTWTEFDDVVGMSGACDPILYKGGTVPPRERPVWQIPYRSLLPRETENLFVAGRCFGYDQGITWDAREISTCMVTGEAAGTAAALCVNLRCSGKGLDVARLQSTLRKGNVRLDF